MFHFGGSSQCRQDFSDWSSTHLPAVGNDSPAEPSMITPSTSIPASEREPTAHHLLTPVADYLSSALRHVFDGAYHGYGYNNGTSNSLQSTNNSQYDYHLHTAFTGWGYNTMPFIPIEQPTSSCRPWSPDMWPAYMSEDRKIYESSEGSFFCRRCSQNKVCAATPNNTKYCMTCAKSPVTGNDSSWKAPCARSVLHEKDIIQLDEVKSFTCSMCNRQKTRKHYIGDRLCCRVCYHKNKPRIKQDRNKCDNCSQESSKNYYRSKFSQLLCHNCFHYKLRTGCSRPW